MCIWLASGRTDAVEEAAPIARERLQRLRAVLSSASSQCEGMRSGGTDTPDPRTLE
jgi:hypothetical protein